jgi:hypothetical protein
MVIISAGTDNEFVTVRAVGNMKWDLDNVLYNKLLVPESYLTLCNFINTISLKEKGICIWRTYASKVLIFEC